MCAEPFEELFFWRQSRQARHRNRMAMITRRRPTPPPTDAPIITPKGAAETGVAAAAAPPSAATGLGDCDADGPRVAACDRLWDWDAGVDVKLTEGVWLGVSDRDGEVHAGMGGIGTGLRAAGYTACRMLAASAAVVHAQKLKPAFHPSAVAAAGAQLAIVAPDA
jgi:hypothetical protein